MIPIPHSDDALALLSAMPDPEAVRAVEQRLLDMPQVDLSTEQLAHGGIAARTILIPAGVMLTGAETEIDNVCIICGDITVTTDDGPQRLTGFHVLTAEAGFKRAGFAHADTYWTTVWRTDLTDAERIEDEMTREPHLLQTRRGGITYVEAPQLQEHPE